MIRTVLVPLDGSELAKSVLPRAEQIAEGTGSELVLLTAVYLSSACCSGRMVTWRPGPERYLLGISANLEYGPIALGHDCQLGGCFSGELIHRLKRLGPVNRCRASAHENGDSDRLH